VETPLHVGSGTELGIIDLPIQRERHTGFPKIEASGLKGCIRKAFEEDIRKIPVDKERIEKLISLVFGPENGDEHAGALGFTDARLLLFPVKSMKGIFAWITCPKILNTLRQDFTLAGVDEFPKLPGEGTTPENCQLFVKDNSIILEEYTFDIHKENNDTNQCTKFAAWLAENVIPEGAEYDYWREKMKKDIVVLPDDDFRDFATLSTEVITRTKINNATGTVQKGALFTEEYLPTETILYSLALTTPVFKEKDSEKLDFQATQEKSEEQLVMEYFINGMHEVMQLGGNATIGKGIVRIKIWGK
jgi:CRISPR-associated protein Cmr4